MHKVWGRTPECRNPTISPSMHFSFLAGTVLFRFFFNRKLSKVIHTHNASPLLPVACIGWCGFLARCTDAYTIFSPHLFGMMVKLPNCRDFSFNSSTCYKKQVVKEDCCTMFYSKHVNTLRCSTTVTNQTWVTPSFSRKELLKFQIPSICSTVVYMWA